MSVCVSVCVCECVTPTVLHFSISVLISGLTRSIRSTSLALHFIISPGTKHRITVTNTSSGAGLSSDTVLHDLEQDPHPAHYLVWLHCHSIKFDFLY